MPRFFAIIFDIGDILFDATPWRRWLTRQLCERGVRITYDHLVKQWEALLVDVYCGRAAYWQRFEQLILGLGLPAAQVPELQSAAKAHGQALQSTRTVFEGVPQTLACLKRAGVKLVALSDTESRQAKVRDLLRQLGIEQYFGAVLSSADIGFAKPSAQAFQAALDAIAAAGQHNAFVGHDIDELTGGRQAGLFAIGYNFSPGAPADAYIKHFAELKDLVLNP